MHRIVLPDTKLINPKTCHLSQTSHSIASVTPDDKQSSNNNSDVKISELHFSVNNVINCSTNAMWNREGDFAQMKEKTK